MLIGLCIMGFGLMVHEFPSGPQDAGMGVVIMFVGGCIALVSRIGLR